MSSFTTPLVYTKTDKVTRGGNPIYRIDEEFRYAFGSLDTPLAIFVIQKGFETDMASIPWPFNKFFPPDGPWAKAAVLHDWLVIYQTDKISRLVQDSIFYEAMVVLNVNIVVRHIFLWAVRIWRELLKL